MTDVRYPLALCLGAALSVAALIARNPGLFMAVVPVLAYAGALLASRRLLPRAQLDVTRRLSSTRVSAGDDLHVVLTVTNCGEALPLVGVRDDVPDEEVPRDGQPSSYLGPIAREEEILVKYTVRPDRGGHPQSHVDLVTWSKNGLLFQEHSSVCSTYILAVPEIGKLPPIELHPRRTHAFAGPIMGRLPGPGIDYFGCRGYVSGDDIRRINWRAVARTDRLVINEYEQERTADVVLVLDIRANAHIQVGPRGTFEPACRAAASLADHLIRQGHRVGLLLYGLTLDWLQPAGGRFHLERILAALAKVKPVKSFAFEDLALIPMSVFPTGSQLIIISSLARDEDHLVPIRLVARGYSVLVLCPDGQNLTVHDELHDEALAVARRIRALRQASSLRAMRRSGVDIVTWPVEEPLAAALHRTRLRRHARGRP